MLLVTAHVKVCHLAYDTRKPVIAPDLDKINLIKELLSVKFRKGQISLFCESEVDFMIWFLCTS